MYLSHYLSGEEVVGFLYFFAIFSFLSLYTIPCTWLIVLYGLLLLTVKQNKNTEVSQIRSKFTSAMNKAAMTISVLYIVTMCCQDWYYALTHAVPYKLDVPQQRVMLGLAVLNAAAKPFIYVLLLPTFRTSIKETFCLCCRKYKSTLRNDRDPKI